MGGGLIFFAHITLACVAASSPASLRTRECSQDVKNKQHSHPQLQAPMLAGVPSKHDIRRNNTHHCAVKRSLARTHSRPKTQEGKSERARADMVLSVLKQSSQPRHSLRDKGYSSWSSST